MLLSRQKEILAILIRNKQWYTFHEIATNINCSTKTIQRDIIIIKDLLPSRWMLHICKGKGVMLDKPIDSSCTELNSLFIRNDMTFKIIHALFQGKARNISDLAELLYISVSSLYPQLVIVDTYLIPFGLTLKRSPLEIKGNPADVIFMYQEFYFNSYGDHEWPFITQKDTDSCLYVTKIEEKLDIVLYPMYKRKLMYLIGIIVENKNKIYWEQSLLNKITDTPFYLAVLELNRTAFQKKFTIEELILIVIAVNCSKYIHRNLVGYKQEVLQHFNKEDVSVYQNIRSLIMDLGDEFQCNFMNDSEFIFSIIQSLKQILSKYYFIPKLNFSTDTTTNYIKNTHYNTFSKVNHVYRKWLNNFTDITNIAEEDIATLTLQIEGTLMLSQPLYVKVLMVIEDGEKWRNYIQGILVQQFGSIFNFISIGIYDIKTYDYNQLNIDVIITTFTSVNSQIPIIRISTIPTNRELYDLRDFIDKKSCFASNPM